MNHTAELKDSPAEAAECEATLNGYLEEIDRMLAAMEVRHRESALLSVQIDARLDHVLALLEHP